MLYFRTVTKESPSLGGGEGLRAPAHPALSGRSLKSLIVCDTCGLDG